MIDAEHTVHFLNQAARQQLDLDQTPAETALESLIQPHGLRMIPLPDAPAGLQVARLEPETAPQAADSLARPGQSLSDLFDKLEIGMLSLDELDRVVAANRTAELFMGRSALTLHHHGVTWLLPNLDPRTLTALKTGAMHHSPEFDHNHRRLVARLLTTDGQRVLALFNLSPFKIRDLERVGLLRFIVHDLSNPLNIAINFADLMVEGVLDEAEHAEGTQIVAHQLHRIQVLLEDLSLLDQVSEDVSPRFAPVDVDVLAATVVNDLQPRANDMHVALTTTPFAADLCQIEGIGRLIQQAIHNLVENAIKYTLPGGWVRVTVYTHDHWLDVLVADDGIGIPPAQQPQLFRPFYRAKDARTAQVDGTGLGLSLVQMVAERHGGSIWFFSVPDKGTIFRLRLPCFRGDAAASHAPECG